ncbi:MAG: O-antigen ligase family protein [Thermoleophilia bacterium]
MKNNSATSSITTGAAPGPAPWARGVFSRSVFSQRGMWGPLALAIGAALILPVLIGYIVPKYGFSTVLVLVVGIPFSWSIARWPAWGLLAIIAFMSTILAPEFLAYVVNPNSIYYYQEAMLFLILAGSLIYWSRNHEGVGIFERLYMTPQSVAVTIFFSVIVIKALTIIVEKHFALGTISAMYNFNRAITFYLLFIPVLLILDTRKKLRWMVGVIFVLGSITMLRVLLELLFPQWTIWTDISFSEPLALETPMVDLAVQRLRAPGGTVELLCFWTGMMSIILQSWTWRRLAFYIPFTLLMLTGMVLEFNRSYILPMAGLLLLTALLNRKYVRAKLISVLVVAVVAVAVLTLVTGAMQKYVEAAVVRYGSALSSQSLESQSLYGRNVETDYALQAISGSPVFGIGLDEFYRPPVPNMLDNLRWYIHNSYLWFWVYFGGIGLLAFLAVIGTSIIRSIIYWKRIADPLLSSALLGSGFTLATLVAANIAAPKFYDYATVPVVALMVGLIEAIILWERQRARQGDRRTRSRVAHLDRRLGESDRRRAGYADSGPGDHAAQ